MRLVQHLDLLLRTDRSQALHDALQRVISPGCRVLDAGCGTGLLSIWAARAGATVVAVDTMDLSLARELARVNGVADAIDFVRCDLRELEVHGGFDVVVAMLYHNDLRRDEATSRLAGELYRRWLSKDGEPIPDAVHYHARGYAWPRQSTDARWGHFDAASARLGEAYGLNFAPLAIALRDAVDPSLFPRRGPDGILDRDDARALTAPTAWAALDYRTPPLELPEMVSMRATEHGRLHAVVWTQELRHRDRSLFSNESVSWVHPAPELAPGQTIELALDERWRRTNVLSPV